MVLIKLLQALLDSRGIDYIQRGDDTLHMTLGAGSRVWQVTAVADGEGFLRYYAKYPMNVPEEKVQPLLAVMNRRNAALRAGCFLIADGAPIFRYGVYIFDEFTAAESVADLFAVATAQTAAAWDEIASALSPLGMKESR